MENLTRREAIKRGAGASALVGVPLLLPGSAGALARAASAGVPSSVVSQLRSILDLPTGKKAGKGLTINMGASMDFSGEGAIYGTYDYNGIKLAVQHINALGPKLKVTAVDSGYVSASQGVSLARQFGGAGYPVMFTSLGADGGAEIPYMKEYSMFTLEAGAGVNYYEGVPFYYQTRALTPQGVFPPLVTYMKEKHPTLKRWAIVNNVTTPALLTPELNFFKAQITGAGFQDVGSTLPSYAQSDFSSNIAALKTFNPDVVFCDLFGEQLGQFIKEFATSGLKAKVVGIEYLPLVQQIAGNACKGYIFAFDYFDNQTPPNNKWAHLFLSEYKRVFGTEPTYYSANYYETTFLAYELIMRIIAEGGDPRKQGDAYVKAFNKNPSFASLYGGTGGKTGEFVFNPATHIVKQRAVAVAEAPGASGQPTLLATANIDAEHKITLV